MSVGGPEHRRAEFGNGGEGTVGVQREGCSLVGLDHCQVVGDDELPTGQLPRDEMELVPEVYGKDGDTLVSTWMVKYFP